MRLREWYSWHFPELSKIISDNMTYAKAVILIGMRTNVKNLSIEELSEVMPEEIAQQVKEAAEISMGTEILEDDEADIHIINWQSVTDKKVCNSTLMAEAHAMMSR